MNLFCPHPPSDHSLNGPLTDHPCERQLSRFGQKADELPVVAGCIREIWMPSRQVNGHFVAPITTRPQLDRTWPS